MITFKLKPHYKRKEKNLLLDTFLTAEAELYNINKCSSRTTKCANCEYKTVCKDIKNAVHHLSHA